MAEELWDEIAVSQRFPGADDAWIVHGRNANRNPKIVYVSTREAAESAAHDIRKLVRDALKRQEQQLLAARAHLTKARAEAAGLDEDLVAARTLLRQATRGGRDMPGHAEVVGGMCACETCAELRRLTGWGVGKRNDGG